MVASKHSSTHPVAARRALPGGAPNGSPCGNLGIAAAERAGSSSPFLRMFSKMPPRALRRGFT